MVMNFLAPVAGVIVGGILIALGLGMIGKIKRKDMALIAGILIGAVGLFGLSQGDSDIRETLGADGVEPLTFGDDEVAEDGEVDDAECPDTGLTNINLRVRDTGASTLTYVAPEQVYYMSDSEFTNGSALPGTSTSFTDVGNFVCGRTYAVEGVTTNAGSASTTGSVNTDGVDEYLTMETHQIAPLQFRLEDIDDDAFESIFPDGSSSTNSTSYSSLNSSKVYEDASATDIAVAQDGSLDLRIWLKTETANQFGGDIDMYMCVDVGAGNEWQEPDVSFNGVAMSDSKASLISKQPDDSTGSILNTADYCYLMGDGQAIGDTSIIVDFFIKARSGQNPDTTDDDVAISFLSSGRYLSADVPDTINTGIYDNEASQALVTVTSTDTPTLTLQIS